MVIVDQVPSERDAVRRSAYVDGRVLTVGRIVAQPRGVTKVGNQRIALVIQGQGAI